jgi:hypothetical protein
MDAKESHRVGSSHHPGTRPIPGLSFRGEDGIRAEEYPFWAVVRYQEHLRDGNFHHDGFFKAIGEAVNVVLGKKDEIDKILKNVK